MINSKTILVLLLNLIGIISHAQTAHTINIYHRFKTTAGKYATTGIKNIGTKYFYTENRDKAIPQSDTLDILFANYNFNRKTDSLLVAKCSCPIDSKAFVFVEYNGKLVQHFNEAAYCDKPCTESYAYNISACLNRYDKKYYWGYKTYSKDQLKNKDTITMSHYYCSSVKAFTHTSIDCSYIEARYSKEGLVPNKASNECINIPKLYKYSIKEGISANAYFFSDNTGSYLQLEYGDDFVYWHSNQYVNYKLVNLEYFKDQLLLVLVNEKRTKTGIGFEYSITNKSISITRPDMVIGD